MKSKKLMAALSALTLGATMMGGMAMTANAATVVNYNGTGNDIEDVKERFAAAVESQTEQQPTERTSVSGSSLAAEYAEWMKAERKEGDVEVFADAEEEYIRTHRFCQ